MCLAKSSFSIATPPHMSGEVSFTIVAVSTERSLAPNVSDSRNMSAWTLRDMSASFEAVADAPMLEVVDAVAGREDSAIPLNVTSLVFPDNDGSERHALEVWATPGTVSELRAGGEVMSISTSDSISFEDDDGEA